MGMRSVKDMAIGSWRFYGLLWFQYSAEANCAADRGCLGGFDRTSNAGKFLWVDRTLGKGDRLSGGNGFGNGDRKVFHFLSHNLEQSGYV
jgi:hypothetical protein